MSQAEAILLARRLRDAGVSHAGIIDLLMHHPHEVISRQLDYLPFRKAKRPGAFLLEAVRHNYSAPKEFFYANPHALADQAQGSVDQTALDSRGPFHEKSAGY
jgi:hypothetical protein